MNRKKSVWGKRAFIIGFIILTSLCWCPWAYGHITGQTLSIPTWAVGAYICAAALFVLEWVFLFVSGLAVSDEDLPGIISDLEAVDADGEGE
ncbi:MAG: DUF997 domain-containing protein [Phycisphaerae bacterium]|jgi:hypothetical protein|nr:DUF997 domain-containing protein [Phycisphaerae bacterium]